MFYVPFNSVSVISGQWKGEHEGFCAINSERRELNLRPCAWKLGVSMADHKCDKNVQNQFINGPMVI